MDRKILICAGGCTDTQIEKGSEGAAGDNWLNQVHVESGIDTCVSAGECT